MTATVSRPTRTNSTRPVPAPVSDPQVGDLLDRCRTGLVAAGNATSAADRFATAHLAALRAAAAMLAARPLPARRTRLRSVWDIVPLVAPELAEWCQFFAATARRRAAGTDAREVVLGHCDGLLHLLLGVEERLVDHGCSLGLFYRAPGSGAR